VSRLLLQCVRLYASPRQHYIPLHIPLPQPFPCLKFTLVWWKPPLPNPCTGKIYLIPVWPCISKQFHFLQSYLSSRELTTTAFEVSLCWFPFLVGLFLTLYGCCVWSLGVLYFNLLTVQSHYFFNSFIFFINKF
jgi:hypothetical protein